MSANAREALAEPGDRSRCSPPYSTATPVWPPTTRPSSTRCSAQASAQAAVEQVEPLGLTHELMSRAQRAGTMRPDVSAADIPMLMCGLCATMSHSKPGFDWRRHLELIIDSLRSRWPRSARADPTARLLMPGPVYVDAVVMRTAASPVPDVRAPGWDGILLVGALMAAASGLVHLSQAPAHFAEWWLFGGLFLLAAALQLGLSALLVRGPARGVLAAVVSVNLGLVVTWALSRTSGLPFGPGAGASEAASLLDVVTTLDELLLVALLLGGRRGSGRRAQALLLAAQVAGAALGVGLTLAFVGGVGHG